MPVIGVSDGHIMLCVEPLEPGDQAQVGAYRLVGRLGAGGMGQVFLGVSRGGRKVAVKVLRADLITDAEFRAIDTDGDGLISLAEAEAFDKRLRAKKN